MIFDQKTKFPGGNGCIGLLKVHCFDLYLLSGYQKAGGGQLPEPESRNNVSRHLCISELSVMLAAKLTYPNNCLKSRLQ